MGNDKNHNWSVLINLYQKYFVMWAIFKMAAFEKKIYKNKEHSIQGNHTNQNGLVLIDFILDALC